MSEISLRIPQIGEGLQEARVVALLKKPGETVKRDEPIYQMETDKAVMDVESPHAGTIVRWIAAPDDVLPIGAEVLVMNVSESVEAAPETPEPAPQAEAPAPTDGVFTLTIPQIGEGLQEARIVLLHKEPGDHITRDEAIFQIETDKAVMDIESPVTGTILKWVVSTDQVVPIGGVVGKVLTSDQVIPPSSHPSAAPQATTPEAPTQDQPLDSGSRRRDLPPRTRAYAKEKGLTDADIAALPVTGKNLTPEDIDAFRSAPKSVAPRPTGGKKAFAERAMPSKQRVLSSRLQRASQLVVPGMMSIVVNWQGIEDLREEQKASGSDFQPSTFTMFSYAVAKAAAEHPVMRSTLVGEDTIRTYENLQLGIAVSLPGDELVVAVVEDSDSLDWVTFATQAREKINLARSGKDQANEMVTLSITNMAGHGIREAMAVVVPPGVATIFLGEPHWALSNDNPKTPGFMRAANVGITIDHRLINGVGGAEFLNAIRRNVEGIRELVGK